MTETLRQPDDAAKSKLDAYAARRSTQTAVVVLAPRDLDDSPARRVGTVVP